MLMGRHWLSGHAVAGQLALMGYLPRSWMCIRDLYSHRSGRALQKAYELLCWWQFSDRVSRRRALALELDAMLDKRANAEAEPDEHEPALLRSEHLSQPLGALVLVLCTRGLRAWPLTRLSPDGRTRHAHCALPLVLCTCNVHAMLEEPRTQKELAHRNRRVPLKLDPTTLILAEMKLRSWLM